LQRVEEQRKLQALGKPLFTKRSKEGKRKQGN